MTNPNNTKQWALAGVPDHPQRERLTNEIHARPSQILRAPMRASHVALLSGQGREADARDRALVAELCHRFGAAEPPASANFWHVDLGVFRLNWERHTEFSTYTVLREENFDEPFRDPPLNLVPRDWLQSLKGKVLVAIHLALEARDRPLRSAEQLNALFASDNIAGSSIADDAAYVYTDFRLHGDGFTRIYMHDQSLGLRQAGRAVQRLLEIETYRMMALLALPMAQEVGVRVGEADQSLSELTAAMTFIDHDEEESGLFQRLSRLAAEVERLGAGSQFRFSAARAYYALVQRRIEELRERRLELRPTIREFMDRRLAPAMRTCESVDGRLESLSQRIMRAGSLLRTRVDLTLEQQSRDLLESMNRRSALQLRLEQTVEGLSVVVLSYYVLALIGIILDALIAAGAPLNSTLVKGILLLPVLGLIWLGIRRVHHSIKEE